jgi:hypothetical protein
MRGNVGLTGNHAAAGAGIWDSMLAPFGIVAARPWVGTMNGTWETPVDMVGAGLWDGMVGAGLWHGTTNGTWEAMADSQGMGGAENCDGMVAP